MDIRKLQRAIVDGLEDVKAQHIAVFNTEALSPLFERVIVASGSSNRQTKALAASVRDTVRKRGMDVLRTEGEDNGEWIIVDCGAAVAHIMQPAIREYYHLEEIWGAKAVKMKMGEVKTGLVKASEPDKPVRLRGAKQPAASQAAPDKRAPARGQGGAKKPAPIKEAATRTVVVGKPAANKAAGKAAGKTTGKSTARPAAKPAARPAPKAAAAARTGTARPAAGKTAVAKKAAPKAAPKTATRTAPKPAAKPAAKAAPKSAAAKRPAAKAPARRG